MSGRTHDGFTVSNGDLWFLVPFGVAFFLLALMFVAWCIWGTGSGGRR